MSLNKISAERELNAKLFAEPGKMPDASRRRLALLTDEDDGAAELDGCASASTVKVLRDCQLTDQFYCEIIDFVDYLCSISDNFLSLRAVPPAEEEARRRRCPALPRRRPHRRRGLALLGL